MGLSNKPRSLISCLLDPLFAVFLYFYFVLYCGKFFVFLYFSQKRSFAFVLFKKFILDFERYFLLFFFLNSCMLYFF